LWTANFYLLLGLWAVAAAAHPQEGGGAAREGRIGGPVVEGARRGGPFSGPRRGNTLVDMASLANGPLTLRNGQLRPVADTPEDLSAEGGRGRLRPLTLDREFFPPDFNFRNQYYNNLRRKDEGADLMMVDEIGSGGPRIHMTRLPPASAPVSPMSQNFENSQNFHEDAAGRIRQSASEITNSKE
jgi:hypothetical protein